MKVAILAGGLGTRLSEETEAKPKPMVEIGEHPILWHIMKQYSHYGFNEFCLALGYKSGEVKRHFLDCLDMDGSLTLSLKERKIEPHDSHPEDWKIHLIETGLHTMTGGRIKRMAPFLRDGTFMLTYGDGLCDVNVEELLRFHRAHGKLATITAVRPPARFGGLEFDGDRVIRFTEKPQVGEGWINGGFFVLEPAVLNYIEGDGTHWEFEPLACLADEGQLVAYRHGEFWQCMDTLRDKRYLESLWQKGQAPWKVWQ